MSSKSRVFEDVYLNVGRVSSVFYALNTKLLGKKLKIIN